MFEGNPSSLGYSFHDPWVICKNVPIIGENLMRPASNSIEITGAGKKSEGASYLKP